MFGPMSSWTPQLRVTFLAGLVAAAILLRKGIKYGSMVDDMGRPISYYALLALFSIAALIQMMIVHAFMDLKPHPILAWIFALNTVFNVYIAYKL